MAMMRCCLCNRPLLSALAYIGAMPVGPTCARRHGLVTLARRQAGALRLSTLRAPAAARADDRTLDLFAEAAHA